MKRVLLAATALAAIALSGMVSAKADTLEDPLHGMVCSGAGTGCSNAGDNGSFTPLASVSNFAFSISPGPASGNLTLVFGVPTDEINTGTFNLPGLTDNGGGVGSSVFSRVNFFNAGSGLLSSYLGLASFSPTDNFSNLSAGTSTFDPTFGGNFLVFTATIPGITLNKTSDTTALNDFSFGSNLPGGSFITGLFVETDGNCGDKCNIGTAASAHLVTTHSVPGPLAGAGLPGILAGCIGLVGLARRRFKKRPV
jgi:hypothetical protein